MVLQVDQALLKEVHQRYEKFKLPIYVLDSPALVR